MMELNSTYNRDDFLKFLEDNFLTDFIKDIRPTNTQGFSSIQKAYSLGRSESLDLQVFEFSFEGSPNKRVTLTKDAFQVMRSSAIFRALAVFHSPDSDDWRLSLMTATPERTEKGKVALSYSNPKRLSFFLGPNAKVNTPNKFILKKDKITDFEDLKSRFSIEVVNKEFYKEISEYFTQLVGGSLYNGKKQQDYKALLKLPFIQDNSQTSLEFAVRLIGRVIFCWFLREKKSDQGKSLMPNDLLSLEAVKKTPDYYHKILEPIFFEVLNKPIKSRKDDYTSEPFSSIPYLNGGLFSPHDDDYYKRTNGDFQSQFHNTLVIPDEWLIKFFEVLETYNFTIDENTSFDEELSIDPEMLGRIFENLLAEINPETGESARKSTGSYYTPRVIVDYMVDESLLLYLKNQTQISEEKLRAVISYDLNDDGETPLTDDEKEQIINALERIKILDPACGSGAFPIGALQKIVFILQQADPEGQLWFKKQIKNTSPEIKKVIEREFAHKNFDYIRKLGIIRENIYGVDIQPIATEISRLRCFLTLVVDERIQEDLENRGIEPLPNLDFKFVTANTLFGLPGAQEVNQMGLFEDDMGIKELKELRDMFFTASGSEREQLKLQFVQAQNRMFQRLISEGRRGHADLTTKLTTWDPFSHKSASWFDPEWMFGIKNGFDIVIANPPYIQIKQITWDERKIYEMIFKSAVGRFNLFYFFLELSSRLTKSGGISSFIVPDRLLLNTQCDGLRKWLLTEQQILEIDSFREGVFESAIVDSILIFFRNNRIQYLDINVKDKIDLQTLNVTKCKKIPITYFINAPNQQFDLAYEPKISKLINDINSKSIRLGQISEIKDGIIQGKVADELFIKELKDTDSKKLLFGEDIKRYFKKFNNNWINYKPDVMMALEVKRRGVGIRHGLWMRTPEIFERNKILTRQTADEIIATWDDNKYYYSNTLHGTTITNNAFNPFYVLTLLNSKLMTWYYRKTTAEEGKVFAQVKIEILRLLPIYKAYIAEQKPFIEIADKIMAITSTSDYLENPEKQAQVKELEKQIDNMVYKLYGLTPDEIKTIENNGTQ